MTQIPILITVEVSAVAATPEEVTSAYLYRSLLASVDAMAEPALWVLMEATVYSLRQRGTLTRSIRPLRKLQVPYTAYVLANITRR